MKRVVKLLAGLGCLTSILAPFLALLLYPRAKWLFAFVLVGIVVLILNDRFAKDPTPEALADDIEILMTGNYRGWEVDDFEHQRILNPQLRELWRRSIDVGGLPETWVRMNEEQKSRMREIIRKLREMEQVQ